MPYKTKHLDFTNATIDEDKQLTIDQFDTFASDNATYKYSGMPVGVDNSKVVSCKKYTLEYIENALEKCKAVRAPRLQEWKDLKSCYTRLARQE